MIDSLLDLKEIIEKDGGKLHFFYGDVAKTLDMIFE
jgi:hypothetical protein